MRFLGKMMKIPSTNSTINESALHEGIKNLALVKKIN
jgi:hypothetical protein